MGTVMKTTSKNDSLSIGCDLSVAPEVKAILTKALIQYLGQFALCEDWKNCKQQFFILQIGELSGRGVQDIYHVCDRCDSMEGHQIRGVVPINCTVQVINSSGCCSMQLYEGL